MWQKHRVGVVIPCFREERSVARVIRRLPGWIDDVCVIDDASPDGTSAAARAVEDPRVEVIRHLVNRGVGASIVTGYRWGLARNDQILVVMAGDDQMDPNDLVALLEPVTLGACDYAKGNRFLHAERKRMPWPRRMAGQILSWLTRRTTGLEVDDTQCGYTAISATALHQLPLDELWPRFGYPNDLLGMVAGRGLRALDVAVRPIYADETSGVRFWHFFQVTALILRRWWIERNQRSRRRTETISPVAE